MRKIDRLMEQDKKRKRLNSVRIGGILLLLGGILYMVPGIIIYTSGGPLFGSPPISPIDAVSIIPTTIMDLPFRAFGTLFAIGDVLILLGTIIFMIKFISWVWKH